jgi:hypothetical protein
VEKGYDPLLPESLMEFFIGLFVLYLLIRSIAVRKQLETLRAELGDVRARLEKIETGH